MLEKKKKKKMNDYSQNSKKDCVEYIDEFGFRYEWPEEIVQKYKNEIIPKRSEINLLWTKYINDVGGVNNIDVYSPEFKKMVRKGIGSNYRSVIWARITSLNSYMSKRTGMYENIKSNINVLSTTLTPQIQRVIQCDVERTWTYHPGFTKEQLRNVLFAFAVIHPDITYCQGLNFLAAIFIILMQDEEKALWMLCILIENYFPSSYFCNQLRDFRIDATIIQTIIHERVPDIYKKAGDFQFEWTLTLTGWFITLFANSFPMPTVLRIWDCFLLEGIKIVFRVCISFLRINHDIIMQQNSRIALTKVFYQLQNEMIDDQFLMETAFKIKAFSKKHIISLRDEVSSSKEFSQ